MNIIKYKAVLSTTVLPLDGTYQVRTLESLPDIKGVPHYVGHPATKAIVEQLGAVEAASKLFQGLNVGEAAICFAIKQGRSTRKDEGFTTPHQEVTIDDLSVREIIRLE
jgi:hypothetical protein